MKKFLIALFIAYSLQGFLIAQENEQSPTQTADSTKAKNNKTEILIQISNEDDMDSLFAQDTQDSINSNFSEIKTIQQPKKNKISFASFFGICKAYINPFYQTMRQRLVRMIQAAKKSYSKKFPKNGHGKTV